MYIFHKSIIFCENNIKFKKIAIKIWKLSLNVFIFAVY